ncbi:MAG TPA: hypothetical protein VGC91_05310 [Pyrinomonadaceae bacterium]|jgi:hypothetical protein
MRERETDISNAAIVFVYNAGSGLFNAVTDLAHKTFSPDTYQCQLCALTYSTFGMRKEWKQFLETLKSPFEFLHADELKNLYGIEGVPLPAVFGKEASGLKLLIDSDAIKTCRTLDDLKRLCAQRLR